MAMNGEIDDSHVGVAPPKRKNIKNQTPKPPTGPAPRNPIALPEPAGIICTSNAAKLVAPRPVPKPKAPHGKPPQGFARMAQQKWLDQKEHDKVEEKIEQICWQKHRFKSLPKLY